RIRQEAASDVEAEIEAAKQEGRQMVTEARAVRERMLTDLARRRDSGRAQPAPLRADPGLLVAALETARHRVGDRPAALRAAAPEPADAPDVETVDEAVAAVTAQHLADPAVSVAADDVEIVMSVDASGPVADTSEPVADASGPAVAIHLGEEPSLTY